MTTTLEQKRDIKPKTKRTDRLSPDGKWRSFPKVPNLLQYVSTGLYFARVKVQGKLIRRGLDTTEFEAARLRVHDFIKEQHEDEPSKVTGTFGEALARYKVVLNTRPDIKPQTKTYYLNCIKALLASWPELETLTPNKITEKECLDWTARFSAKHDEQYFNNTLFILRAVLERAGLSKAKNPAFSKDIKRLGVKRKSLEIPEPDQFEKLVEVVGTSGAGQSKNCADFIRFLAYSGCRVTEAAGVTWSDVSWKRGNIRVMGAKSRVDSSDTGERFIPIIPPMRELLARMEREQKPNPTDPVCQVNECQKSLDRACPLAGVKRITHHDMRHMFATRCIESGVDIPTVSRWLGHKDGGALAMRVYGHLCQDHSNAMGAKVTFEAKGAK